MTATTAFGPQGPNFTTTRPPFDPVASGGVDTWFKNCSAAGMKDGTFATADFFNVSVGNLRYLVRQSGVALDSADDTMVYQSVQALIAAATLNSQQVYAIDVGTTNHIIINPAPSVTAYRDGLRLLVKVANTVTGASDINVNGLGVKPVAFDDGNTATRTGDILAGSLLELAYNGTYFQITGFLLAAAKKAAFKRTRATFSTPGAFSWNVPPGVTTIKIFGWGAGGGGGFSGAGGGASGGSGGARGEQTLDVTPGQLISGVVGAGGAAATTSGSDGSAGSGTTITVGVTTYTAGPGLGGHSVVSGVANSVSGGSTTNFAEIAQIGEPSGGGLHGYSGSGDLFYAGRGGNALNGGLGGQSGTGGGNPGIAPGGGGGGGANNNVAGAGANGAVWIEY
jgi:hypothetical protein